MLSQLPRSLGLGVLAMLALLGSSCRNNPIFNPQEQTGIIIKAQTNPPGSAGSFRFTGVVKGALKDGQQLELHSKAPGNYAIREDRLGPAFALTGIVCDDANSSIDLAARKAAISLEAGETVTCVFTNTRKGSIIIENRTEPAGAVEELEFYGAVKGSIADKERLTVRLPPRTYTVMERTPDAKGFVVTSVVCDDGNSVGDPARGKATINLEAGETVKCVFTNAKNVVPTP